MVSQKMEGYGWKPSLPSPLDVKFTIAKSKPLPSEVDLRKVFAPEAYDQKKIGSCTGQTSAFLYQYAAKQAGLPDIMPSRLFIYWNERFIEGSTGMDAGAEIKSGLKAMNKFGVCSEDVWLYDDKLASVIQKPSEEAFAAAKGKVIHNYATVDNTIIAALKQCLAHGFPIAFGFTVYESFEGNEIAVNGTMSMPDFSKESVVGGHAVTMVGYNNNLRVFIVRNSWGSSWGDNGYFYMPFEYATSNNFARDFWMLRLK